MATATTLHAARVALIDTSTNPATGLIPSVVGALSLPGRITYGWGWPSAVEDLAVLLMDARTTQEWRTSNRGRNEAGEIEVLFLAATGQGEQTAAARAFAMLTAVDTACRQGNGLGGILEEIACGDVEFTVWNDNRSDRAAGGFAHVLATFKTRAIIRG